MPTKKMRIMLVGPAQSIHVRRWVEFLTEQGHELLVVTEHRGELPSTVVTLVLPGEGLARMARYWLGVLWLRWKVHALRPDLIHVHSAGSNALLMLLIPGRRLVVTPWGGEVRHLSRPFRGRIVRLVLLRAALVLTTSSQMRQVMLDQVGVHPSRVEAISWGIQPQVFSPVDSPGRDSGRARWGLPPAPAVVVVSHRSTGPVYRTLEIARAFRRASRANPNLHLVLLRGWEPEDAGAREAQRQYRRRVYEVLRELPASNTILIDRPLDPADVASILSVADSAISIPAFDQRSSSILEAVASGLRVLASDIEPYRELTRDGASIELLGEPIEDRLVQALVELQPLSDAQRWAAHRLMERQESWPRQSARIEQALLGVAK